MFVSHEANERSFAQKHFCVSKFRSKDGRNGQLRSPRAARDGSSPVRDVPRHAAGSRRLAEWRLRRDPAGRDGERRKEARTLSQKVGSGSGLEKSAEGGQERVGAGNNQQQLSMWDDRVIILPWTLTVKVRISAQKNKACRRHRQKRPCLLYVFSLHIFVCKKLLKNWWKVIAIDYKGFEPRSFIAKNDRRLTN